MERTCSRCHASKPIAAFARDRSRDRPGIEGRTRDCKDCRNVRSQVWARENLARKRELNEKHKATRQSYYADPARKARYRDAWLLATYGISAQEYEEILKSQEGVCAICKQPQRSTRHVNLVVDHCHSTGRIRGLLCSHCNRALGLLGDAKAVLVSAISYLERNES